MSLAKWESPPYSPYYSKLYRGFNVKGYFKNHKTYIQKPKTSIMKKIFLISFLTLSLFGCNMNPNKEARIQQLETKIEQTFEEFDKLEIRVQTLESVNAKLESRILELENQ